MKMLLETKILVSLSNMVEYITMNEIVLKKKNTSFSDMFRSFTLVSKFYNIILFYINRWIKKVTIQ